MSIKLKDIANAAEVSEATASLALNDSKLIKETTRRKVKKIAEEMGYSPNARAQGLAKRKSNTIGLVIPDIEIFYYSKLVRCIDENVRERGYNLVLAISNDKAETEKKILENFISERVEGIIIVPVNKPNRDPEYINTIEKNGIPYIFTTARYPEIDAPYIMVDLEEGTYRLVKYLLDMGHRNIAFLTGSSDVLTTSSRISGYKKAFDERKIPYKQDYFIECTDLGYTQAYEIAEKLTYRLKDIDAIMTINDMMALAVVNAMLKGGIKIPEDISVAGYDDMIYSRISPITITTVRQDLDKLSSITVDILFQLLSNTNIFNQNILIKPDLIIRESTSVKK